MDQAKEVEMAGQNQELTQFAVRLMDMVAEMRQSAAGVERPASPPAPSPSAPPDAADTVDTARAARPAPTS